MIIGVIFLIVIIAGLIVGIFLVKKSQNIREKAAPASTLSILPATKTVSVGETFDLSVRLDTRQNAATAVDIYIQYDPNSLSLIDFSNTSIMPQILFSPKIDNTLGQARAVYATSPGETFQGQGDVATLKFKALASGSAIVSFGPETKASGVDETTNIIVAMNPSQLTILDATFASVPTPTPGSEPLSPPSSSIITGKNGTGGTSDTLPATPTATPTLSQTPTASPSAQLPVAGMSTPTFVAALGGLAMTALGLSLYLFRQEEKT